MQPSPLVEVVAAVITRADGGFLLAQRPAGKVYEGYWEFPGGKMEAGEALPHALARELHEELGIVVETAYPWITREFLYPHARVRLNFFRVVAWHGELIDGTQSREGQTLSWQFSERIDVAPLLPANAPVLAALKLPPVYAISNAAEWGEEVALARLQIALDNGARLLQVREKTLSAEALRAFAEKVVALGRTYGAKVLINGGAVLTTELTTEMVKAVGADGVHLSSAQLMNLQQRPEVALCGASCHNAEALFQAQQLELDFVVLGAVNTTASHPHSATLGWRKFSHLIQHCAMPVYALGGMRAEDLVTAWEHGAHGIAFIRGQKTEDGGQ